jgi:hypothetical protein
MRLQWFLVNRFLNFRIFLLFDIWPYVSFVTCLHPSRPCKLKNMDSLLLCKGYWCMNCRRYWVDNMPNVHVNSIQGIDQELLVRLSASQFCTAKDILFASDLDLIEILHISKSQAVKLRDDVSAYVCPPRISVNVVNSCSWNTRNHSNCPAVELWISYMISYKFQMQALELKMAARVFLPLGLPVRNYVHLVLFPALLVSSLLISQKAHRSLTAQH